MMNKIISIKIEQFFDGWHVVAYIDERAVEVSPAILTRAEARRKAQIVAERVKAKFASP
jgi:hypothetical protein